MAESKDERALRIERERNEDINRRNAEAARQAEIKRQEDAEAAEKRRRAKEAEDYKNGFPF